LRPAHRGGEGIADEQYYALCVEDEHGEPEIAFFELSREALPGALGISLYTSPDGELQRRHLQDEQVLIVLKSHEDLLEAMSTGVPSSIYLDGERIAGSVFKAMLEIDLGIPLQRARSAMSSHSSGARIAWDEPGGRSAGLGFARRPPGTLYGSSGR
jgi:hypothetical protein